MVKRQKSSRLPPVDAVEIRSTHSVTHARQRRTKSTFTAVRPGEDVPPPPEAVPGPSTIEVDYDEDVPMQIAEDIFIQPPKASMVCALREMIMSDADHHQSQNDYMREWLPHLSDFVEDLLRRKTPPNPRICSRCNTGEGLFRCEDCFNMPAYCASCCKVCHVEHPFHRMQRWDGQCYQRHLQWQAEIELEINLGHHGALCPRYGSVPNVDPTIGAMHPPDPEEDERERGDSAHFDDEGWAPNSMRPPTGADVWYNRFLTIVDTSGIHYIRAKCCLCHGAPSLPRQLLQAGLYPISQKDPRTVFTFKVLDDCLLDNLECKTAYNAYYSKLRRKTSKTFPHLVLVRRCFVFHQSRKLNDFRIDTVN